MNEEEQTQESEGRKPFVIEPTEYDKKLAELGDENELLVGYFVTEQSDEEVVALLKQNTDVGYLISFDAYLSLLKRAGLRTAPVGFLEQARNLRDNYDRIMEGTRREKQNYLRFRELLTPLETLVKSCLDPLFQNKTLKERLGSDPSSFKMLLYLDRLLSGIGANLAEYAISRLDEYSTGESALTEYSVEETILDIAVEATKQ